MPRITVETVSRLKMVLRNMILNQARLHNLSTLHMIDILMGLLSELRHDIEATRDV